MKTRKAILYLFLTIISTILFSAHTYAQKTIVKGIIRDAVTKETIPFASIFFNGTQAGTQANLDGIYTISTNENYSVLKFSFIGYETVLRNITPGTTQNLDIFLKPSAKALSEVVVIAGKKPKYINKGNPAVELIRKVIDNKEQNRLQTYNTVSYRQYEKMFFSLSNISDKFKSKKIFNNYQFLFQEQDSTQIGGKNTLPIYIQEKLSDEYYNNVLNKKKSIIIGEKQAEFDNKFVDNKGIKVYFNRMYSDIDIYQNNILLMTNEFLSPISSSAPTFYKYFITDTLKDQTPNVIELSFTPRNTSDMLFEGQIYITMDGNYAVQKAVLNVNRKINLNFVRALKIDLDFQQNEDRRFYLSKSKLLADFGISKEKGLGFTGERSVSFKNYKTNITIDDSIFVDKPIPQNFKTTKSDSFWAENRLESISDKQLSIYTNIDTLQTIPSYRRTIKTVSLLFAGFYDLGKYEIGPVNTFYSFNNIEGFRLRFGGRTTTALSKRYYFENYAAYGFKDEKWKYFLSGTYSINNKSIYTFPQHYIRASFQRDTKIPGQELQFVQEDNILLSFKRGVNDMLLYNDFYKIDYIKEYENNFSFAIGLKKWTQTPAGSLFYRNTSNPTQNLRNLTTSEISIHFRYAPNQTFYQGKLYRLPFVTKYPIFNLRYTAGLKGVLGGEYNYHNFMGSAEKRFFISQLGYSDVKIEGGYIIGKLPFPLLNIHRANQTYAYQSQSFNMMNFLEFISDHYASINIDHNFNGFFLNKIPLIKKLKFREIVTLKALYGGLRNENNPNVSRNLYQLPQFNNGLQRTYTFNDGPYVEGSLGLGNIFKFFRVDAVKRFNYLHHPEVADWGVRATFKFDF